MAILELRKPLDYNGVHYDQIEYDLDGLSGDDLLNAEGEVNMENVPNGIITPNMDLSKAYHAAVFARAAKIDFAMMRKLSAKDFTTATTATMVFFGA